MTSEDNREKIVATALQMFNTRGCRGVTMDDIAQAMHISKRTLYETFANKEELLAACLGMVHERTNAMHRRAHSQVDEPLLVAMYMLRTNALSVHKYRHIIEETERYYPEIHDTFFRLHSDSMREMVERGMDYMAEHGYMRPDADRAVAVDFMCSLAQRQRLGDVADPQAYKRQLNEVCFTYLRGLMTTETLVRYDSEVNHFAEVIRNLDTEDV